MSSEARRQRAWLEARDTQIEVQQRFQEGKATQEDLDVAAENLRIKESELRQGDA